MNLSLFSNSYRRKNSNGRNPNWGELFQYFVKLIIGELTGNIYYKNKVSDHVNQDELISNMKIIDVKIREILNRIKIENYIDVEKKKGFENIGYGCLISPMFGNLMAVTQGEASFFFPTSINEKHSLKLMLFSVPKVSGIVKFEENIVHRFSISTLSDYNIDIEIKPEYVRETLSKISIAVDEHWSPKYLDKNLNDFPLGIIVKSIKLVSV